MEENETKGAVTKEVAAAEIKSWLDFKKINEQKRLRNKSSVESLVDAMVEGTLSLTEDKVFEHHLKFPLTPAVQKEGAPSPPMSKITYKPRLAMSEVHTRLQQVKSEDADGRVACYISAISGQPMAIVRAMDSEDYGIGQSIAIFFL